MYITCYQNGYVLLFNFNNTFNSYVMCDFMKVFKVHVVSGMFFDVSSEKILDVGYNNN